MAYFPREETETVELFDVEYERDDAGDIVTQGGRPKVLSRKPTGQSLTVVRKDAPVDVTRVYLAEFEAAANLDKRIKALTKELTESEQTDVEYDALQDRINELKKKPDQLSAMCAYIASSLKSWDYFASKADYEAKKPVELQPAALRANCDPRVLGQIVDFLSGRRAEEIAGGKDSAESSPDSSRTTELSEAARTSTQTLQ